MKWSTGPPRKWRLPTIYRYFYDDKKDRFVTNKLRLEEMKLEPQLTSTTEERENEINDDNKEISQYKMIVLEIV